MVNPNDVVHVVWQCFRESAFVAKNSTNHIEIDMVESFPGAPMRVGQVIVPPHTIDAPSAFDLITYRVKIRANQPPVLLAWTLAHEFVHIEISGILRLTRKAPKQLFADRSKVEGLCELAGLLVSLSCWSRLHVSGGDALEVYELLRKAKEITHQHNLRLDQTEICAFDSAYRVGLWRALDAFVASASLDFGEFIKLYLSY